MRKDEVVIGRQYHAAYGVKAEITGGPRKRDRWSNVYVFDAEVNGHDRVFEAKEINRVWTDEDEQRALDKERERLAFENLTNKLAFAGFPCDSLRYTGKRELFLSFTGMNAKRIIEHVLGEELTLEYEDDEE